MAGDDASTEFGGRAERVGLDGWLVFAAVSTGFGILDLGRWKWEKRRMDMAS